jgi:hypothetical protein
LVPPHYIAYDYISLILNRKKHPFRRMGANRTPHRQCENGAQHVDLKRSIRSGPWHQQQG